MPALVDYGLLPASPGLLASIKVTITKRQAVPNALRVLTGTTTTYYQYSRGFRFITKQMCTYSLERHMACDLHC